MPAIDALMEFIYSGEVKTQDLDVIRMLFKVGQGFQIGGLKERCVRQVLRKLGEAEPEEYISYYKLAEDMDSPTLLKMAIDTFER